MKNRETADNCRLSEATESVADISKAIYTVAMLNERRMIDRWIHVYVGMDDITWEFTRKGYLGSAF